MTLLPLYTTDAGGSVLISSDTWPGTGGTPGRTAAQIEQAQRDGIQPAGGGGFVYMTGPDNALVEFAGNYPVERFNHVHLYQEDPLCALLWYQTASQRAGARGCRGGGGDRGELQGAARRRSLLAGAQARRHVPLAARRRRIRRRRADLVSQPGRAAAGVAAADSCRITSH